VFSKRTTLHKGRKYTREFFEKLVADLHLAGFNDVDILLPHNIVQLSDAKISVDELLKRERNYAALILSAHNALTQDTLKILFVNRNRHAVFADDTFPNAVSEPPQLFVQSNDPVRCFGLFGFFREYLQTPAISGHSASLFVSLLGLAYLIVATLYLLNRWSVVGQGRGRLILLAYAVGVVVAAIFLFRFFATPTGLWIKPKRELKLLYLANMALKGEFKDNPLVTLLVSVVGTILTVLLLKLLGLS
jgi:hypothetical protein